MGSTTDTAPERFEPAVTYQTACKIVQALTNTLVDGGGTLNATVDGYTISVAGPALLRREIFKWQNYIRRQWRTKRRVYAQQQFSQPFGYRGFARTSGRGSDPS